MGELHKLSTGRSVYVEVMGEGAPLVFMHGGLGFDHGYLKLAFERLAADYQVIFYDHFGNGRSEKPEDYADLNFDAMVADANALIAHLGHEKVTLIGHSYGGFVAQEFVAKHSDKLNGLALLNTVPAFDYEPKPQGSDEELGSFGAIFGGPQGSDENWRKNWNGAVGIYFNDLDATLAKAMDENTHYVAKAWETGLALLATFNTLETLPKVAVPSLVVGGTGDNIVLADPGPKRIAGLIPNAQLEMFEGSAHYPFFEEPEAFFTMFNAWLASL